MKLKLKKPLADYEPSREKKRPRVRGWILESQLTRSPRADAIKADLLDRLWQHVEDDTLPRGGRGLFYDLRPLGIPGNPRGVIYTKEPVRTGKVGNMEASPEDVQDMLAKMRRVWNPDTGDWLVPEHWIADSRTPDPDLPFEFSDAGEAADYIDRILKEMWLVRQAGQPVYLELRCESQDLVPRVARIARPYGVPVYSGSGADALKPKKDAARRAADRGVPTLIGHLADYDKAGGDIADAFFEDARAFNRWHIEEDGGVGELHIDRIALTHAQALAHDLLDSNGKAEVDGLPVPILDQIVRDFIEGNHYAKIRNAVIRAEPSMRVEATRRLR